MFTLIAAAILCSAPPTSDTNEDLKQLTQDHTQFAFSLNSAVENSEESLVFSPFSISTCLSMLYLGARGETESQMQKGLRLDVDRKNIAKAANLLNLSLEPAQGAQGYQLKMANALWVDQDTFLLADFRYAIEKQFRASLNKLNFSAPSEAALSINTWTSQQTQGKIPKLLGPDDINAQTRLVLTNAVYFEGVWKTAFNPKNTQDWPFHPTPDSSSTAKMLHQTASLPYCENELVQMAALPFVGKSHGGGDLAFVLILPKSAENWGVMMDELPKTFNEWLSSLLPQRVELKLPKFTLNTRLSLNAPLKDLGMEDPFDSSANFSGIDGMRDLFLSTAVHEAFFALDENGVTAAAATAAALNMTSAPEKEPPILLIADHPFLFFIVDLKSQEMLFMGKVLRPSS